MKKIRLVTGILVTALLVLGLALPVSAEVEPPEVIADLEPGESMTVDKVVTTPEIPPKPDIYFLADTTGSMGPVILAVKANAGAIMTAISTTDPSAQFGVGNYRDYPYDTLPPFYHQQGITANTAAVQTAINTWSAGGGADGSEGQFYALTQIANPGVGWRSGSSKIVVWFGDAPAHDPVPMAATGFTYDITEATVTAALQAAGIRVIAISTITGIPTPYYPNGLDDNPTKSAGDYATAYPGYVAGGASGQASRIATATGGIHLTAATPDDVVDAILEGLTAIKTDVWWEVEADDGLIVTLDPVVYYDVTSGTTVTFVETVTLTEDAPQCHTLYATVTFYANSYPEEGAVIGVQKLAIHVKDIVSPEVWCVESVNPHGKTVPPAGKTTLPGPKGGQNEDGFYQLFAEDNCDPEPGIYVSYVGGDPYLFGPFTSGIVVKFTEAPGAIPECKKMGSSKGQAGAVSYHIILPSDPIVTAVDTSGNVGTCTYCLVPPPPK